MTSDSLPEEEDIIQRLYKALEYVGTAKMLCRKAAAGLIPATEARRDIANYMGWSRGTVQGIVEIPKFSTPAKAELLLERKLVEISAEVNRKGLSPDNIRTIRCYFVDTVSALGK